MAAPVLATGTHPIPTIQAMINHGGQANEINARYGIAKHVWQTDGDDSTGFGVAPNFG